MHEVQHEALVCAVSSQARTAQWQRTRRSASVAGAEPCAVLASASASALGAAAASAVPSTSIAAVPGWGPSAGAGSLSSMTSMSSSGS